MNVSWRKVFSPDSKTVASVSHDDAILLWDAATGDKIGELMGHKKDVRGLAFHPDGERAA